MVEFAVVIPVRKSMGEIWLHTGVHENVGLLPVGRTLSGRFIPIAVHLNNGGATQMCAVMYLLELANSVQSLLRKSIRLQEGKHLSRQIF